MAFARIRFADCLLTPLHDCLLSLRGITSDLPAGGLSRMTSCLIRIEAGEFSNWRHQPHLIQEI